MIDLNTQYAWEMMRKRRLRQSAGYRTEDLILQLDAINNTRSGHNASTTTWEDLSGNNFDITLYNATWGSDYCSFTGNDNSYGLGGKYTFATGCTIEVIYSNEGDTVKGGIAGWSFASGTLLKPALYLNDAVSKITISMGGTYNVQWISSKGVRAYVGFNKNTLRHNTNTNTPTVAAMMLNTETPNNFRLAAYGTFTNTNWVGGCLNGRVCAVRVYDANLTAEELYAHWLIDKARFNIQEA